MIFLILINILTEYSEHSVVSDLDLHCLYMSYKKDTRLIWVYVLSQHCIIQVDFLCAILIEGIMGTFM